jgi:hypothetical protein
LSGALARLRHFFHDELLVPVGRQLALPLVVGTDHVATITSRLAVKYAGSLPLKLLAMPIAIPPIVEMLQRYQVHTTIPRISGSVGYSRKRCATCHTTTRRLRSVVQIGRNGPEVLPDVADFAADILPRLFEPLRTA